MEALSPMLANSPVSETLQDLKVLRRIAMFLMGLGVQVSAQVMNRLTPEELRQVAGAIADLEMIDLLGVEALRDSQSMRAKGESFLKLGPDHALHFVREGLRCEFPRPSVDVSVRSENLASIDRYGARGIVASCG